MDMTPSPIVKDFDVIEDISPGKIPGFVDALADAFLFQAAEERFGDRIIPAVAAPAHAWFKIVGLAEAAPVIASVLAALVRVCRHGFLGLAPPNRHQQSSIDGEFPIEPGHTISTTGSASFDQLRTLLLVFCWHDRLDPLVQTMGRHPKPGRNLGDGGSPVRRPDELLLP